MTENSREELKPCAHCGGKGVLQFHPVYSDNQKDCYSIECDSCWISTYHYFNNEESAIKSWNTRTPPSIVWPEKMIFGLSNNPIAEEGIKMYNEAIDEFRRLNNLKYEE